MKKIIYIGAVSLVTVFSGVFFAVDRAMAANTLNPFSSDFRLVTCDGPALPTPVPTPLTDPKNLSDSEFLQRYGHSQPYVPCDATAVINTIQFFINAMIMLGVLAAIVSLTYAGYLYLSGTPGNISRAKDILWKTAVGFIVMLCAWFIVYQLLDWFAAPSAKGLLK